MTVLGHHTALLQFIGMINYLSPFCENLSTVIQPPRVLTQEAVPYLWSEPQDSAFNKAKELVSSSPVLAYYDLNKPVILQTDASDYALGSALLQPITSCLHILQLEPHGTALFTDRKGCLAIYHCFQKFDQWFYGKSDIQVHMDTNTKKKIVYDVELFQHQILA